MYLVKIELARVQTFLFAVPRLRSMLGANASLGETMRRKLVLLACGYGAAAPARGDALIDLPEADSKDPLTQAAEPLDRDDPLALFRNYGVLAREGGHFSALFSDRTKAEAFASKSAEVIAQSLPGILARIDIGELGNGDREPVAPKPAAAILDLPVFQVCQETGIGPAAITSLKNGKMIGLGASIRETVGNDFSNNKTFDIIGLMRRSGKIPRPDNIPEDLNALTGGDYLALVHADGNGIGKRYKTLCERGKQTSGLSVQERALQNEIRGERFFHSMRVAVRRALTTALNETFDEDKAANYQLLMLGGDDLLLACRAKSALPFVRSYAKALEGIVLYDLDPLTVGVGVAIAKPSYPFHRLHQLAEKLAASAKRLYRANHQIGSVVDWHICTQSWAEDPIAQRRETALLRYRVGDKEERLVLSQCPYAIVGEGPLGSLSTLLDASEQLAGTMPARSQRRALVESCRKGRLAGELAWAELPDSTRKALKDVGKDAVFGDTPWIDMGNGNLRSPLGDLVDLLEINHLGAV